MACLLSVAEERVLRRDLVIEPGENDVVDNQFVIPANVQELAVFSYISNPDETSKQLGWRAITFYNLQPSTKVADAIPAKTSSVP